MKIKTIILGVGLILLLLLSGCTSKQEYYDECKDLFQEESYDDYCYCWAKCGSYDWKSCEHNTNLDYIEKCLDGLEDVYNSFGD